jgi:hypothetical protein
LAQLAWIVILRKEHFPNRSFDRPPLLQPALQPSDLAFAKPACLPLLQVLEHSLGLKGGLNLEALLNLSPNIGELIGSSAPCVLLLHVARQRSPRRYFGAVFGSIPALTAATSTNDNLWCASRHGRFTY